jgi:hypothetical protein
MLLRQSLMFGREVWGQRLGGDQWECLFSRLVPLPLTWLPCDFSMNRHKQRGLTRHRESDGTKIWQWTLGTGRLSG